MASGTEFTRDFCAGIGPLQFGVVLVYLIHFQIDLCFQNRNRSAVKPQQLQFEGPPRRYSHVSTAFLEHEDNHKTLNKTSTTPNCSGPIPAEKLRANSVPRAVFSHLILLFPLF